MLILKKILLKVKGVFIELDFILTAEWPQDLSF